MKYYLTALTLTLFLAACSSAPIEPTNSCPGVKQYSKDNQKVELAELQQCHCPNTIEYLKDYKVMRDQSRACKVQ